MSITVSNKTLFTRTYVEPDLALRPQFVNPITEWKILWTFQIESKAQKKNILTNICIPTTHVE